MEISPNLTEQLQRFSGGDREIAEELLREILPELHRIAVRELGRERYVIPFTPTELINEAWLRSLHKGGWEITSRAHFYSVAALVMRRVLVDFARSRLAQRRGKGDQHAPLQDSDMEFHAAPDHASLVEMGLLMERLDEEQPEAARVVDMHYFAGFTLEEIAENTGLTLRQVRHRWAKGRDWLKDRLDGKKSDG
jgi:RNA polymerase sigma factor (TIGR02999 family)